MRTFALSLKYATTALLKLHTTAIVILWIAMAGIAFLAFSCLPQLRQFNAIPTSEFRSSLLPSTYLPMAPPSPLPASRTRLLVVAPFPVTAGYVVVVVAAAAAAAAAVQASRQEDTAPQTEDQLDRATN